MTFRSQQMKHYRLYIPRQNAYNVISEMAKYQMAHIVDNGDILNRPFSSQIKRCQQSSIKIEGIIQRLQKQKLQFQEYDQSQKLFIQKLYYLWQQSEKKVGVSAIKLLDSIQQSIQTQYLHFRSIDQRLQKIKSTHTQLLQQIACYQTIQQFLGQSKYKRQSQQYYLDNIGGQEMAGVSFMVGVVDKDAGNRLGRMIYRVSRGYACIKEMSHFQYQPLQNMHQKIVLIIYPTSKSSILQKKIQRVVESFCHYYFIFSKLDLNTKQTLQRLKKQYEQIQDMTKLNEKQLKQFLNMIRGIRYLQSWRLFLWKQRLIYQTLNKFQVRQQLICGQIYIPSQKIQKVCLLLSKMSPSPTLSQLPLLTPPSSFTTNCYTTIAQQITNTYGIPRYQQINPSILTTVTFPFFFGVMFGDIAHGACLLVFGLFLVFCNQILRKTAFKVFSQLRYMILMMGFFAFYCGWIYNDFMGMNMNFFGSCYNVQPMPDEQEQGVLPKQMQPEQPECIYPFGIDPVWGRSKNNLQFVNSLKMKISVIIAIVHMTVGVVIKAFNSRFFKKTLDFYHEFIPQFIFLFLLFGYMDFLVVYKWLQDWSGKKQWAPSIISTMMNIGLKMGQTSILSDGGSNMWGQTGNTSQDDIQLVILVIALICVPWMLLPKPIIQIKQANQKKLKKNPLSIEGQQDFQSELSLTKRLNPSQAKTSHLAQSDSQHQANQIFVHQLIQTIQYVLGAISNTASYLRLWALSLAHSQLALVFFQKTLQTPFSMQASIITPPIFIITFYMLIWVTFGILMCMDSMECFLHSLRLHWVEFQNKFFKGDGYRYQPLSFSKYILQKKNQVQL